MNLIGNLVSKKKLMQAENEWNEILCGVIQYFNRGCNLEAEILYSTYLENSLN